MPEVRNVAVLDDFTDSARSYGDWDALPAGVNLTVFGEHLDGADAVVAALEPFDVVVAMRERTAFPAEVLARLPHLRLLVTTGPANAAIAVGAAREQGVTVCGTGGVSDNSPTVEMTWALIHALTRNVVLEEGHVRQGLWQRTVGRDLRGHRLGVVGLGGIGTPVARIGQAYGMDVVAWSANLDPAHARSLDVTPVSKRELCETADVITIHMKLSERSTGLIGRDDIAAMTPRTLLVNASRGPIVDEDALLEALHAGAIGGAGLDVFGREPLPVDSPWRRAPRTVLTPHLGYVTEDTFAAMYHDVVEDILAWADGAPVRELGPEHGS